MANLIDKSFYDSVAPTLTSEGVKTFLSGVTPESIKRRLVSGNTFIVCKTQMSIVGVAEVRNKNHLNLFFVETPFQKRGVGRILLEKLIESVQKCDITVNSSLNAVEAYTKLGFQKTGMAGEVRGICFQPMTYKIRRNFVVGRPRIKRIVNDVFQVT